MKLVHAQVELGLLNQQICLHQQAGVVHGTWVAVLMKKREGAAESRLDVVLAAMVAGLLLVSVTAEVLEGALFDWKM